MGIEYDDDKRRRTLQERGLDMAHAADIFRGYTFTVEDQRWNYGEQRFVTRGVLDDDVVVVVWTPRNDARRIISIRRASRNEREDYRQRLGSEQV